MSSEKKRRGKKPAVTFEPDPIEADVEDNLSGSMSSMTVSNGSGSSSSVLAGPSGGSSSSSSGSSSASTVRRRSKKATGSLDLKSTLLMVIDQIDLDSSDNADMDEATLRRVVKRVYRQLKTIADSL